MKQIVQAICIYKSTSLDIRILRPAHQVGVTYLLLLLLLIYQQLFFCFTSSRPEVFCKKGVLRNFAKITGNQPCQSLFFKEVADLRPGFPLNFCEISKNTFSYRTLMVALSAVWLKYLNLRNNGLRIPDVFIDLNYYFLFSINSDSHLKI